MLRRISTCRNIRQQQVLLRLVPELLGVLEILFRFGILAFSLVCKAPEGIRRGILRVQSDGLGEVGNRLVVFALVPEGDATLTIRLGILRAQPDGLGEVGNCLVVFAIVLIDHAAVAIDFALFLACRRFRLHLRSQLNHLLIFTLLNRRAQKNNVILKFVMPPIDPPSVYTWQKKVLPGI